jgi:hypothetical protein
MKDRRDKCKCGKIITWDTEEDDEVICPHCQTKYKVDCDSVLVYWLVEKIEKQTPYKTGPR